MKVITNAVILTLILITVNLVGCTKSNENVETNAEAQENQIQNNDEDYKQRYTTVLCRQFDASINSIFWLRQRNYPKQEATERYTDVLRQGNEIDERLEFIENVIEEAYKQPIYYPEIEENPFILEDTRPDDKKRLTNLADQFTAEQYDKCLNELTGYMKRNHESIFGSAYVPKPN